MTVDADIRQRHLLVIATGEYADPAAWPPLPVEDEVRVWTDWLTDEKLRERRFVQLAPDLTGSPRLPRLNRFLQEGEIGQIHESDALVLVVTGHGQVVGGVHRVVLSDSGSEPQERTSLRTEQLISFIRDTRVQDAVVVIDTCHAGDVTRQMLFDKPLPHGWIGIAAAAPTGQAFGGAVSQAVAAFLNLKPGDERYGGPNQPFFSASALVQFITDRLGEDQDIVTFPRQARSVPSPCLPNPLFVSAHQGQVTTAPERQELALREDELSAHWGPHARGVHHWEEAGWLFTGRTALLRDLIGAARGDPGAYLVTGAAGSGKSAALSRLVTWSDPRFRSQHAEHFNAILEELRPQPGDVDVAVHAQGKTPHEILDRLCSAFEVRIDTQAGSQGLADYHRLRLEALRTQLSRRVSTIVIDALDKATNPLAVLTDVLAPLTYSWETPTVRLILGIRSMGDIDDTQTTRTLAEACRTRLHGKVMRVDVHPYWHPQDLVDYVHDVLLIPSEPRTNTPYTDHPEQARAMARRVADLVGTSYLVAQVVARQLAAADTTQDPDDRAWQSTINLGLATVLTAELASSFPDEDDRNRALTVLRAASLAFGPGIPWRRIWPAIATAIAHDGTTYGDADIRWLLSHRIGGYLIRDLDAGATVYRPFHDALKHELAISKTEPDHLPPALPGLGAAPGALLSPVRPDEPDGLLASLHSRIIDAMIPMLGSMNLQSAVEPDRYLRRHLAAHAEASGRLDQLLDNPHFVLTVDPDTFCP